MSLESRNTELDKKLGATELPDAVAVLINDAKKRRRQVRWLAISIALDFVLTIGITVLSVKTNELAGLAQSNRDAVVQNCETANDSRKRQLLLWNYVFSIPPSRPMTHAQEVQLNKFKGFVDKTFAQRDCKAEIGSRY